MRKATEKVQRASYRDAINWIARNDDTEFLLSERAVDFISVTAYLVADIFGVSPEKVIADLRRELSKRAE